MYDPEYYGEIFTLSTIDAKWWNQGEPIWTTTVLQGLKAGFYFWPGTESNIMGVFPTAYRKYNNSTPYKLRVDTAITWLAEEEYDLVGLYFSSLDSAGHLFGPESENMSKPIEDTDGWMGYIMTQLKSHSLDDVNVVVVGDHGMTTIDAANTGRIINLTLCIDETRIKFGHSGPQVTFFPVNDSDVDQLYEDLKHCHPHLQVYLKSEVPAKWHYSNNRRIGPLVLVADDQWYIVFNNYVSSKIGNHGFDNYVRNMRTVFMANGPDFRRNIVIPPMSAVDVYPLICTLLDITAAPNNGSLLATMAGLKSVGSSITSGLLPPVLLVTFINTVWTIQ